MLLIIMGCLIALRQHDVKESFPLAQDSTVAEAANSSASGHCKGQRTKPLTGNAWTLCVCSVLVWGGSETQ